jgi:hypothetical protein
MGCRLLPEHSVRRMPKGLRESLRLVWLIVHLLSPRA